jgi:hypothetical protein
MRQIVVISALLTGCLFQPFPKTPSELRNEAADHRLALRERGAKDIQCPENVDQEIIAYEVRPTGEVRDNQIVYEIEGYGTLTWCEFSALIWKKQLAAIESGVAATADVSGAERYQLLEMHLAAHRARVDAAEESARALAYEKHLREEQAKRQAQLDEQGMKHLGQVLVARGTLTELTSAKICHAQARLRDTQAELDRSKRIARVSGAVWPNDLYEMGQEIVDAEDDLIRLKKGARLHKLRLKGCGASPVAKLVSCFEGLECQASSAIVAEAHAKVLSVLENETGEAEERAKLPPEKVAQVESDAAQAIAAFTPP